MIRGGDFGEHMADMAASGYDITAPVPYRPRRQAKIEPEAAEDLAEECAKNLPVSPGSEGASCAR